jgi:exosortase K
VAQAGPEGGVTRRARLARLARERRWQLVGLIAAVALVCAGKQLYRHASAHELRLLLAPTAGLVSLASGVEFVFEAGAGWVSRSAGFIIAPGCAGMNFLLAVFLALAIGWGPRMRDGRGVAAWLARAAAVAYAATLGVNAARITFALALHRRAFELAGLDRGEIHRIEGIVVYLGGLLLVYGLASAARAPRGRGDAAAG